MFCAVCVNQERVWIPARRKTTASTAPSPKGNLRVTERTVVAGEHVIRAQRNWPNVFNSLHCRVILSRTVACIAVYIHNNASRFVLTEQMTRSLRVHTGTAISGRIVIIGRIIKNVSVEIQIATEEPKRVFTDKASRSRIVVSGAIIVKIGLRVKLTPGIAVGIRDRSGRGRQLAVGIVGIGIRQCP
jgi:hypothetical protein